MGETVETVSLTAVDVLRAAAAVRAPMVDGTDELPIGEDWRDGYQRGIVDVVAGLLDLDAESADLYIDTVDELHEMRQARFTGNLYCARCGLVPVDVDDVESPCEGVSS